ncbi:MAG: Transcriptional regulatory protein ZraR [Spirochaetes bacterium ADurb.BinA120]|nr:MAG: Transcriptional regulatory protein ZraR [Spirochaetes bacterium ADurb.BinA120]HPV96218.1 sigma 54-interacting transcriptional regulator [Spirochaetota bacterium]
MSNGRPINDIILDSIADGVFTVDMDFRITYINRAAGKILGISEEEAIGKYCYEIFHANICEHSCALDETIETGRTIVNKTIYIVNASGERIPISISTALLKDENGAIIGGVETFRDISEVEELRRAIEEKYTSEDIVSKNKRLRELLALLPDIAESDSSVLIEGQSGTGKELVARAIHNLSARAERPIIVINCAALPESLLESELFGYKAGAFTDARRDKPGKFAAAEGGTLFLDEIGEIQPFIQVKLLRFLQEREYEPLGSLQTVKADVRIVAATNKDLLNEVHAGRFRDDLYYRLNVINISLPPLAERREDIPLLIRHFIKKYNAIKGKDVEGVSDEVINVLMEYDYPGNIRELENAIEHAFALCKESYIQLGHLPARFRGHDHSPVGHSTLEDVERHYIQMALERHQANRSKAARELGIDPSTLWRKMKKFGIE